MEKNLAQILPNMCMLAILRYLEAYYRLINAYVSQYYNCFAPPEIVFGVNHIILSIRYLYGSKLPRTPY
jgi:hypothetical protein